jgi:hypothetical protein
MSLKRKAAEAASTEAKKVKQAGYDIDIFFLEVLAGR